MRLEWLVRAYPHMAETKHFDVVISGAAIAGASLAVALSGNGLSIALIEAQALAAPVLPADFDLDNFDPRVSALTPKSQKFLASIGAWDAIAAYRLCTYRHMTVWDSQGTGQIDFDEAEVDGAGLGHIVENRSIVSALLSRVDATTDITVFSSQSLEKCTRLEVDELSDAKAQIELQLSSGTILKTNLLVAADGALSQVRQLMDFETREWDYGHHAIVTTIETAKPHQHTAWQSFAPAGPLALLPLPGDEHHHYCSIVWSQRDDEAKRLLALEDADFCQALQASSESRLGEIVRCSSRYSFPLRQRHAVDYVQDGVALIADAAHTIHPLAGQGINLGIQDVAVLAKEVLAARERGVCIGELAVLQRYQRQRKGENLLMMTAMDGFKHLFEQEALPLRWLRNAGMRGINSLLPIKQQLMRHAMGLG